MSQEPNPNVEQSSQRDISLDELAAAFAEAMDGVPPAEASAEAPPSEEETQPDQQQPEVETAQANSEEDNCPIEPRTILEAMLFVGSRDNQSLTAARAAELMRGVEEDEIGQLVTKLNERYAANGCPYRIVLEGTGYKLSLTEKHHGLRNRFYGRVRQTKLSQAAIDVLALVAYKQPLTAENVSQLRDKPSGHILSQLVRRGLLRIERKKTKRRTAQYFTTDRFLKLFELQTLEDLPQSEELDRQ
jgi:segregation and condensation protein B